EKRDTHLFETLQKSNARYWLNALIKILNFAGIKGLVILLDDLEVLAEKKLDGRFKYTTNAVKDAYELLRQLIDDMELLSNFLLILAGDKVLIDDDERGLKSYEALWMRLQTGLVPLDRFNPFADMVNIDLHLKSLGEDFHEQVMKRLIKLFEVSGLKRDGTIQTPDLSKNSLLRAAVIETALRAKKLEEE
ncbi:ATP-binding protein, partial [bacterium]|nr:ATP-binding protein [bacterium]